MSAPARHLRTLVRMAAILLGAALLSSPNAGTMAQAPGVPPAASTAGRPVPNETYQWRPVAIGGGGYITGIDIDRSGKTRVARTDVYGAYRWDERADRWSQLVTTASMPAHVRPRNGVDAGVYEIAVAPGDASRLYMVFESRFYRSDDAGRNWSEPQADAPFYMHFNANSEFRLYGPFIAVSPVDPDRLFLGTPEKGLWASSDGGRSWQRVESVPAAADLRPADGVQTPGIAIWFDPRDPSRVLAASAGNGLWISTDGGKAFAAAASGPRTIMRAAFGGDGAFWASDEESRHAWVLRGDAWRDLTAAGDLPKGMWRGVAAGPASRTVLFSDAGGYLWCTADSGSSWSRIYRVLKAGERDPAWLAFDPVGWFGSGQILRDPSNVERLWVASGMAPFTAAPGDSCPKTLTWNSLARGIEEIVASDVVQPPGHAPLFAGWDFGIHVKPDLNAFSKTFGPRPRNIIAAQQVEWSGHHPAFLVTNASDTRQCCADDGQSVLAGYSTNGGLDWTRFPSLPHPPGTSADDPWRMAYGSIAVSADDVNNIVWVPGKNRAPFVTLDRGRTWRQIHFSGEVGPDTGSFGPMPGGRKSLAADRVASGTFYLLHNGPGRNAALTGFWRSKDKGRTWRKVHQGEVAPNSGGFSKLRAVPGRAGHLFLTAGVDYGEDQRLRRSRDGGKHWQALNGVDGVDDIGFGKPPRRATYPTIFITGRVAGRYGLWRSLDNAASWELLIDYPLGWLTTVAAVEGDKDVFGRVYVGYVGGGWLYGEPAPCRPAALEPGANRHCSAVNRAVAAKPR